jgi:hypothetical protein
LKSREASGSDPVTGLDERAIPQATAASPSYY